MKERGDRRHAAYHPAMPTPAPNPWWLLVRAGLYVVAQFGLMYVHLKQTTVPGTEEAARAWLAEGATIEWLQIGALTTTLGVLLLGPARRGTLGIILALTVLATMAREFDALLKDHLWEDAHRIIMFGLGIVAGALALWPKGKLHLQLQDFLGSSAFWLMLFGFTLVVLYGLVLGQTDVWLPNSVTGFDRINKRFVEEGLEFSGYVWVLFGAFELLLAGRRQAR